MITAIVLACTSPMVHDGDGIRCPGGQAMRLAAIDAPEFTASPRCARPREGVICDDGMAQASRDHLRRLVAGKPVRCRIVDADPRRPGFQGRDPYKRPVVRCFAGRIDLSQAQRRGGWAAAWPSAAGKRP